ncbi:DMT family transporter [Halorarius litoreus]|uniref:DMT family transporter n=1 Tax=Halorarius litoreus TaxID=2962676 RepID=UPI0020CE1A39|nr:DMT family transporter [Halorarius litoreus]
MNTLGVGFAMLFALLMGTASIFSRRGLEHARPAFLLLTSLTVAAPIFFVLALLTTDVLAADPGLVALVAVSGVIGSAAARSLYFQAIKLVGPGKALSLAAVSPLFVAVLSAGVLGEPVTPLVALGTGVIVLGVAGLSRDSRAEVARTDHSPLVLLVPVGAALLIAVAVVVRKAALNGGIDPVLAGAVNMGTAWLVVAPVVAGRWGSDLRRIDPQALRQFTIASVLMAVGFLCYFIGLQRTPASVFFPLIQTQPVFAIGLSALFLGGLELLSPRSVLAAVGVVLGAVLITLG